MSTLPIALLHAKLEDGELERNRLEIVRLASQAADEGARLIVAPELAASGYLSLRLDDVAAFGEHLHGPTTALLADIARRRAVYICTGFCEFDPRSNRHHNSAVVIGPPGAIVAHHRKVVCELRWATPGAVNELSRFDTPWGQIGVLICADTYNGLLPRTHALHEADLIIVPANWPDCGLDPREVWRARVLESGIGLVVCNRTGRSNVLDCTDARSYAMAPGGRVLLDFSSEDSTIAHVAYPLDSGRLASHCREVALSGRSPNRYEALSWSADDRARLQAELPEEGRVLVECVTSSEGVNVHEGTGLPRIVIAPRIDEARHSALSAGGQTAIITPAANGYATLNGHECRNADVAGDVAIMDFGPIRIALVKPADLVHPEAAAALVRQGCDLVVAATQSPLTADDRLLLGIQCTHGIVVAALGSDGGIICVPPLGHERWRELSTAATGACSVEIESAVIRRRIFIEHLDLEALLQ